VVLKHRKLADEWFLPSLLQARIEGDDKSGQLVFRGTALLDPRHAAGGRALRKGLHDFFVRVEVFGLTRSGRLDCSEAADPLLPVLIHDGRQNNRLYATSHNKLSVNVKAPPKWRIQALESATFLEISADRTVLDLGTVWAVPPRSVVLTVSPARGRSVSWALRAEDPAGTRWRARVTFKNLRLPIGEHRARLKIAGSGNEPPVRVTLKTPFRVTGRMRLVWLVAALEQLPSRIRRYLLRRRRNRGGSRG
jgi:hypothetical protein